MGKNCKVCLKKVNKSDTSDRNKCTSCLEFYHFKCLNICGKTELNWICNKCQLDEMPFSGVENTNFMLTLEGKDAVESENFRLYPSFTIQSLLDKIPGTFRIETDEFISDSIQSKYYTPDEFVKSKIPKNVFTIFHMNIASLSAHITELKTLLNILNHPFSVIGISESKIKENLEPVTNLEIDGYFFDGIGTKSSFGGVGLYIRKDLDFDKRKDISKSNLSVAESIFYEITLKNKRKFLIGCIYRHHTSIRSFVDNFLASILQIVGKEKNKACAIMGDFNADLLQIDSHEDTNYFYNILTSQCFRPLILQPTRVTATSATLIDNIFINDMTLQSTGGNITSTISDHFTQFCALNMENKKENPSRHKIGRSYKNFNHDEFKNELRNIRWPDLFYEKSCEEQISIFLAQTNRLLDEMAPVRKLTKKEINLRQTPWLTNGILKSMKSRDKLHSKFLKAKDPITKERRFIEFKRSRNLINSLVRNSKKNYYNEFFIEYSNNAKKTWEGIRDIIKVSTKNRSLPNKLLVNQRDVTDKTLMAENFNEFFVNIGNMFDNKIPEGKYKFTEFLKNSVPNSIFLSLVDGEEVLQMLSKTNTSKSCGPNSIPSNLLKNHSENFSEPIVLMINKSLSEGVFPDLLKIAQICPIYKKGARDCRENYRPISLLSNLSKLFERAMHRRVYNFLESTESLFTLQFGFRKKHSTSHALISIVEEIRQNLDNNCFSCGVFVDLEKAFDTVNHKILLKKLEHYGIRNVANTWFESYLSNRKQFVSLDGNDSNFLEISCGVPQGSILGPLLFIIYINDIHQAIKYLKVHHFADDTNLLFSNKNVKN